MAVAAPSSPLVAALAAFEARLDHYRGLGHDREAAVRWVVDALPAAVRRVLDVGTGKGLVALELARRGVEVVTVDPDAAELALARARVSAAAPPGPVCFVQGDVADLGGEGGPFAAAVMMDVLHHLAEPDRVFAALTRLVAPEGVLVVAEFDAAGFELVARVHRAEGRTHRVGPVTMARATELLADLGWRLMAHEEAHLHERRIFHRGSSEERRS
ncbi:MAG: class I SAM-dependent methyltransferase [Acidobacteriota bacterium]|jgi:2-polyprenyl-3-methyl-5-hydroxy-6-metoxy-1,4-benzoquinol methylase